MKNKLNILVVLCLLLSFTINAQKTRNQKIKEALGRDANISKNFIHEMIKVAHYLDCDPWDESKPCTDIIDPWEKKTKKDPKKQKTISRKGQKKIELTIINAMKHFENAITLGEGGKILTKKHLTIALNKYPGYKLGAMRSRFNFFEAWPAK